jgi:hypothetical protein
VSISKHNEMFLPKKKSVVNIDYMYLKLFSMWLPINENTKKKY